jgi:hypothetical protein
VKTYQARSLEVYNETAFVPLAPDVCERIMRFT